MTRLKFLFNEEEFQEVYKKMAIKYGLSLDPDDPKHFYNYRALYKETGKLEPDETGHFPSKWKLEGHPNMYVEGVKTKEKEKIGWAQRMRGIGELPKYEIPKSTKLKFIADIGLGIGAKAGIPLAKPEEKPKPLFQDEKLMELHKINFESFKLWFKELKESKDKIAFLKGEGQSPELKELRKQYKEKAPYMYEKSEQWIENVSMISVGIGMAWQLVNVAVTSGFKVKGKVMSAGELKGVLARAKAAYVPETGKFKATLSDNDFAVMKQLNVFFKTSGRGTAAREMLEKIVEKTGGLSFPQQVNIFGGRLYAGLPADEIVRSLVKAGKVTADIARELSLAKPELVSQVIQNLSVVSPAIAAKLGPELTKLIPKVEPKRAELKPGEKITREYLDRVAGLEKKEEIPKVEPKEPWQMTKKEYIGETIWIESAKNEHIQSVVRALREGKPVPPEVLADYPELKAVEEPVAVPEAKEKVIEKPKVGFAPIMKAEKEMIDMTSKVKKQRAIQNINALKDGQRVSFYDPHYKTSDIYEVSKSKDGSVDLWVVNEKGERTDTIAAHFSTQYPDRIDAYFTNLQEVKPEVPRLLELEEKYPERFAKEEIKEFKKFITEEEEEFIKVEREYPAKIVKEEIEELKPLATPAQIKKAHAIANTKALISEKGKMKPQYREIAKAFTDQKSIKDMTKEEAEVFIDMLDRLPEPTYKAGKLTAPSIPRTMKLTVEGFFQKKYGEPTPIWLLEDQTYYATRLGIHPLVAPFERGKQEFDLEFRQSSHLVDRMVNKLNTIAKTPGWERVKSKIKNIPTKAESKMAELLNKHEATPPGLTSKEEDIFKYFRNLSKDIWRRENEVREKVDLPPIKYKQAYFRHTADAMAKEMLEGKYPFPQGIKYWGEKMVGKKIFNPMEFHRKLSDDLIDLWSKDIRAVTKAMLWSGLKEIYLAQPAKFLNEQLNAISKDLPEYKNLSPRDQAAYDKTRVMPASTRKWLVNYINQVLKGQETELDASLNRIVTKSGLKGIFDKALSPFGRTVGRKPITNLFVLSGRAVISGVMGWVPRQIMRNSFQPVQNLALYGVKATIKAYLPASVDKNLKGLMSESLFLKSYTGYEELPTNLMGKLEKVWLGPYGIVAVNNAKLGMKAAYWNIIELIKNPKFKKHGWADPQRTKDTPKGKLYPSEKEKLLREMEFGASATQYQYIPMGMPGIFRYKALVPLTRLQSWWMNYFTKFLREASYRAFKGRPSWSGEDGPTLPWSRRVNFLKYLIIGGAILTSLGYRRSFLLGVLPVYLSPAMQLSLGLYNYATATEDWKREKALRQIYYSWKAFIPGSLAWRDFLAVWKGEKELEEILFYGKKEEKKVQPPLKITIPESKKLKFIEPEIKKSTKLKFTF